MFHYMRGGQQQGPVSEAQLRQLVTSGQVSSGDSVWTDGMPGWAPLFTVLQGIPPPAPSVPPPPPVAWSHPPPPQAGKTRVAYILLGLFLGTLGIHNFYAGYTGRGVAQLLITLLTGWLIVPLVVVGFWNLIEIITVTQDAQGTPLT